MKIIAASDGCVKGRAQKGERAINHSACGFIITDGSNVIANQSKYLGKRTISEAEYYGLIDGLMYLKEHDHVKDNITFYMDSEFIVKQMNDEYKCNAENIFPLFHRAKELLCNFSNIKVVHHTRETQLAKAVDRMVTKQCLDSMRNLNANAE